MRNTADFDPDLPYLGDLLDNVPGFGARFFVTKISRYSYSGHIVDKYGQVILDNTVYFREDLGRQVTILPGDEYDRNPYREWKGRDMSVCSGCPKIGILATICSNSISKFAVSPGIIEFSSLELIRISKEELPNPNKVHYSKYWRMIKAGDYRTLVTTVYSDNYNVLELRGKQAEKRISSPERRNFSSDCKLKFCLECCIYNCKGSNECKEGL